MKLLKSDDRISRWEEEPPSLVSLCLGVGGWDLEDIIEDLSEIAVNFPAEGEI